MLPRILLMFAVVLAVGAQNSPPVRTNQEPPPDEARLPDGKLQRQEILKADYRKSIEDARELSKLADELKIDLEKNDYNVFSIATLKKVDDIDKLARHIHDRLKRF